MHFLKNALMPVTCTLCGIRRYRSVVIGERDAITVIRMIIIIMIILTRLSFSPGPPLFSLGTVIHWHGFLYHYYADDTLLFFSVPFLTLRWQNKSLLAWLIQNLRVDFKAPPKAGTLKLVKNTAACLVFNH